MLNVFKMLDDNNFIENDVLGFLQLISKKGGNVSSGIAVVGAIHELPLLVRTGPKTLRAVSVNS